MQSHKEAKDSKDFKENDTLVWKEDPLVVYKQFLEYAGEETNLSVSHNQNAMQCFKLFSKTAETKESNPKTEDLEVHAHNGKFYPLDTALRSPIYCSKVTLRNFKECSFLFKFGDKIIPGIVGIEADDIELCKNYHIAYRNIVPSLFSQTPQLAGPMGYHEYLIDGNNYEGQIASLSFFLNSDFNKTPIKVVVENCKGELNILGLTEKDAKKIFENKCTDDLALTVFDSSRHKSKPC